jgi:exonuclease III
MVHLVSWNVAGWLQTVKHIKTWHGSVLAWLAKHKIDILCLQEVKTTSKRVMDALAEHGMLEERKDPKCEYESFWGCCTKQGSLGFNGVCICV